MWRRRILYAIALLLAYLGQILDVGYLFHFIFFAVLSMPLLGLLLSLPAMLGCRAELRCSSHDKGPATRKACDNGCIGCKLCVRTPPGPCGCPTASACPWPGRSTVCGYPAA